MTQVVFCTNCLTETDATDQVSKLLESGADKVRLEDLDISCCKDPTLKWITSPTLIAERKKRIKEEIASGRRKRIKKREKEKIEERMKEYMSDKVTRENIEKMRGRNE